MQRIHFWGPSSTNLFITVFTKKKKKKRKSETVANEKKKKLRMPAQNLKLRVASSKEARMMAFAGIARTKVIPYPL